MASQFIKAKLLELQKSNQHSQSSRPKIQKVAGHLRDRIKFKEHYLPKLVSIGPIHHGNTNLKLGEKYKLMWAAKYIENTQQRPKDLYQKIAGKIAELKGHFDDNVLTLTGMSHEGFGSLKEKLSWMLFVDGCSLLHILYESDELLLNIKSDQMILLIRDVLLLENQLPYEVLKLLWKDNNDHELIKLMRNFLKRHPWGIILPQSEKDEVPNREGQHSVSDSDRLLQREYPISSVSIPNESQSEKEKDVVLNREGEGQHIVSIPTESETPTHLLDIHRKILLTKSNSKTENNEAINKKWSQKLLKIKNCSQELLQKITIRNLKTSEENAKLITNKNIKDLKARGIILKPSATQRLSEIDFSTGWFAAELILPEITVDDNSAAIFLNLIAYEMCPDFKNKYEICSFVYFMDTLIDHPEDVTELRLKGILHNYLGSDEEVANLFNIMGTDMTYNQDIYKGVIKKIDEHYCNKYKTWIAQGFHTYFHNPWTIIAFLAACIALALTFIQTLFTINPPRK